MLDKNLYEIFVNQAPNAIAMFDKEMKYIAVSQVWQADYKLEGQEIIGKSHYEVFPEIGADWKKIHQRCLEGEINRCEEGLFVRADGTRQWISWDVRPWYEIDKSIGGLLMYTQDITKRKRSEEQLNLINQRLLLATKGSKIGIWDQDIPNDILIWDDEMFRLYGISKESFGGNFGSWITRVHPEDRAIIQSKAEKTMRTGEGFEAEFRVILPDQSIRFIRALAIIQRSEEGVPLRLVGTNVDITAQKEFEKVLRRVASVEAKSKEIEQLAYIVSHDLREPLLSIKGLIELLRDNNTENLTEEGKGFLGYIDQSIVRMEDLINDLLDYSQLSKTKELKEVDCKEIIEMVCADLHSTIQSNNAKIVANDLPTIKCYSLEIKLLFQNLISNAIKFRKKDTCPEIKICSKKISGGWEFEVEDNGIGIHEENQKKIFVLFQKLHSKAKYEGTGIGLAHVKKIVELHKGGISVESEVDKGTIFRFNILTDSVPAENT